MAHAKVFKVLFDLRYQGGGGFSGDEIRVLADDAEAAIAKAKKHTSRYTYEDEKGRKYRVNGWRLCSVVEVCEVEVT